MRQVGYLPELYENEWSEKYLKKKNQPLKEVGQKVPFCPEIHRMFCVWAETRIFESKPGGV